jgi:beta-glucosidase
MDRERETATVVRRLEPAAKIRLLSGASFWRTEAVEEVGLPSVMMSDGPHGLRLQGGNTDHLSLTDALPATCFPTAVTLASSWDEALLQEVGDALGAEARASGVDVLLGPGLNLKRHPAGGRNFEYFSEDPLLSGRLAAAMVRGIQARGVGACPKHFAVNNQESCRMRIDAIVDERTLRELYLTGFEIVVERARPWAIMSAYNRVNGEHAGESRRLLTEILRDTWGFDGVVVSDWFATYDRPTGVQAGMDLEMPHSKGMWDETLQRALDTGALSWSDVDAACERLVRLAQRAATGGPRPSPPDLETQHALARRAAAAGTVLLKNDGLLPLVAEQRVGVIGAFAAEPRYQGGGSSKVKPTRLDTLLTELRAQRDGSLGDLPFADGYDPRTGQSTVAQREQAVALAKGCDVVVLVVGLPTSIESEGWDREHLSLPRGMDLLVDAVLAANPRTVVVLQNGAPVHMPWVNRAPTIVEAWLGGQAGGAALADVLTGAVEPGGRLAESFPVDVRELAADADFGVFATRVVHREGLFVGYRFHDTFEVAPLFPFGHGLGYTTWSWGEASVEGEGTELVVVVPLTNTGDRRGSQVVQLYVHDPVSTLHRPEQELKAFAKLTLDPGACGEVRLHLDRRSFAVWDVASSSWSVEAGVYALRIGASSRDIRQTVRVEISSDDVVTPVRAPAGPVMTDAELACCLGHPVPPPAPVVPFHRDSLIADLSATHAGAALRRLLRMAKGAMVPEGGDEETRKLVETAMREAAVRMVAANIGGPRALATVDGIVRVLNRLRRRG